MDAMYNLYDSDGYSPFGEKARQKAEQKAEEARLKSEEARQRKIEEQFRNNTFVLAQQLYDESPNHEEVEVIEAKAAAAVLENDSSVEEIDLMKEENKENNDKNVSRTLFQKFGLDGAKTPDETLSSSSEESPTQGPSDGPIFAEGSDGYFVQENLCPYCLQNPCDNLEDIIDTRQRLAMYYNKDIPYNKPKDILGNFQRRRTYRAIYKEIVIAKGRGIYARCIPLCVKAAAQDRFPLAESIDR